MSVVETPRPGGTAGDENFDHGKPLRRKAPARRAKTKTWQACRRYAAPLWADFPQPLNCGDVLLVCAVGPSRTT